MDHSLVGAPETVAGTRDPQTVSADGMRAMLPKVAGVQIVELGNVLTRSGSLLEIKVGVHPPIVPAGVWRTKRNESSETQAGPNFRRSAAVERGMLSGLV